MKYLIESESTISPEHGDREINFNAVADISPALEAKQLSLT